MLLDVMSEAKVVRSLGEVRRRGLSLGRILISKEKAMADSTFHLSRISLAAFVLGRPRHGTQRKSEEGSWLIANTVVGTQLQVGTVFNPWALQM